MVLSLRRHRGRMLNRNAVCTQIFTLPTRKVSPTTVKVQHMGRALPCRSATLPVRVVWLSALREEKLKVQLLS